MKVIFAPYYDTNPYQKELIKELQLIGITVGKAGLGASTFFKTKNLNDADVIHYHWFEPYILSKNPIKIILKIIVFLIRLKQLKKTKKYIWTAHNLKSHESKYPLLEQFFLKKFVKMMDGISVHNLFAKEKLMQEYGVVSEKIHIIPHANYINAYPEADEKKKITIKDKLGIDSNKFTFLFLGYIRPYKGVLDVISAFKELGLTNAQLIICGNISINEERKVIEKEIYKENNIKLVSHYINDEDMSSYLALADVMVYPYKDILTSGGLLLGMSYKKACIASNVGSMPEFLDEKFLFTDFSDLKQKMKLISNFSKEEIKKIGEHNFLKIKEDSWSKMAEMTLNLYNK
jgi:beta-1,4-mannosyltransferase